METRVQLSNNKLGKNSLLPFWEVGLKLTSARAGIYKSEICLPTSWLKCKAPLNSELYEGNTKYPFLYSFIVAASASLDLLMCLIPANPFSSKLPLHMKL